MYSISGIDVAFRVAVLLTEHWAITLMLHFAHGLWFPRSFHFVGKMLAGKMHWSRHGFVL